MTRREQDLLSAASIATFKLNGQFLALAEELARPAGLTAAWWQVLGAVLGGPLPVAGIAREMDGVSGRACSGSRTSWSSAAWPSTATIRRTAGPAARPDRGGPRRDRPGPGHADAAGRLATVLGEDALAGAVDTLRGLSAALDQIQSAPVMTRTSGS